MNQPTSRQPPARRERVLARTIRRLRRLPHLFTADDRIQELTAWLREVDDAQSRSLHALEGQVRALEKQVAVLRDQVDMYKSSQEVPEELVREFHEWKSQNPVPPHPLISVCIATYNRVELLMERCLPSVLAQTYDRFEVIVVGDGCTDGTTAAMAQVADNRVRFVNLPARGEYPADPVMRWMVAGTPAGQAAIDMAGGDFLAHIDDDDEYLPEKLEKLALFVEENQCDVAWHPFWGQDQDGEWVLRAAPEFSYGNMTPSSVMYRKWFKRIRPNPLAYRLREPGDWNWGRRVKYIGPRLMRCPEPLSRHYRERSQIGR